MSALLKFKITLSTQKRLPEILKMVELSGIEPLASSLRKRVKFGGRKILILFCHFLVVRREAYKFALVLLIYFVA